MTVEHWQRIKSLFEGALSLTPEERENFLNRECPNAPELQAEVRRLLENESLGSDLLELGGRPVPSQTFVLDDLAGGRFRIVRLLGRGGMGEVYEAEDTLLHERLALKAIRPEIASDPASLTRFRQEIQLARRVTHPNVCRIFDLEIHSGDTGRGSVFLTMELLSGETLAVRLRRTGALPPPDALALARQMGAGLEAAHQCGIVHRDFKTSNVMLVPGRDGSCRAVITDFGLARGANLESGSTRLTGPGNILGTPDYMAPEQLERGECSFRSDIYSFGLVLYEMVTGELPFAGKTPMESALRRVRETPPSPRTRRPELSRAWDTAIAGCLQRNPSQRSGSAAEVVRSLESDSVPKSGRYAIWVSAVVLLALVIGAGLFFSWSANQKKPVLWKPVPLTSFGGVEFHPALSPDGELVAFSWDSEKQDNFDIYVKQIASGALSRLTNDPAPDLSPAWSPDGRLVAFRRLLPETNQIILKSYLGGPERKLAEWPGQSSKYFESQGQNRDLCFSPDGKWIVASGGSVSTELSGLFAVSVETGESTKLTSLPGKYIADSTPALSPDGRILAFTHTTTPSVSEIYIMALSGLHPAGVPRPITFDNRIANNPAWTTDGRAIIFSSNRKEREAARHLWRVLVPDPGGAARPPEPEFLAGIGDDTNGPTLSRNGHRLAYSQDSRDLNVWEIHLPENPGQPASATPLISSTRDDLFPDFSPDGRKIVFGSNRSGYHEIWVCERDGSNPVQLTSSAGLLTTDPHWSPNGTEVLFSSRGEKNRAEVYVINAQGGTPRRLTHCPADCTAANWSRDGKWIYFSSPQNGTRQIWKMPAGGGHAVQLTKVGGIFSEESVDHKYLYYSTGRDADSSVWRVPVDGGDEVPVLPSVSYRNFAVTDRGIYFNPGTSHERNTVIPMGRHKAVIQFYSFATRTVRTVFTTEKPVYRGLVVSPDGHSLLYTQFDRQDTDLWLVDDFR